MSSLPHLTAHGLRQTYRLGKCSLEILRGIDLEVAKGEVLFLRGASGAGKSTLLYTLAGLERPSAGEVIFEGHPLFKMKHNLLSFLRNERMGFVFQAYFLLPELTAFENVHLPAMVLGKPHAAKAKDLLDRVGLGNRLNHLPSQLSGGEQQRVAIARALMNDPTILFADEPTGNLDAATGATIIDLLLEMTQQDRRTLIAVTHDPVLASRGDRELLIVNGLVQEIVSSL
ncbi:MAG: ABC transporter ATP-binding protein [Chthoniobacterales bacterium]|nr:ABC transporter ATP-binding protein [Chthoniobacterales bacterium]